MIKELLLLLLLLLLPSLEYIVYWNYILFIGIKYAV